MANRNKKKNQPPTGEGKKQSPASGEANKLNKRSEVLQAQHGRAEENIDITDEEIGTRSHMPGEKRSVKRAKAGR
jgi:hypothetical protein